MINEPLLNEPSLKLPEDGQKEEQEGVFIYPPEAEGDDMKDMAVIPHMDVEENDFNRQDIPERPRPQNIPPHSPQDNPPPPQTPPRLTLKLLQKTMEDKFKMMNRQLTRIMTHLGIPQDDAQQHSA
jgi:hypothetical protein